MIICMRRGAADVMGLEDLCREVVKKSDVVVEIGCYMGESTNIFAQYAGRVYCIDRWKDGLTELVSGFRYQEMAKVEDLFDGATISRDNIIKIRGDSDDLVKIFGDGVADLVYVDSLHDYDTVHRDITCWWPKIKCGGYIAGHNYSIRWPGLIRAVREVFGEPDKLFRDSSWLVRKRKKE